MQAPVRDIFRVRPADQRGPRNESIRILHKALARLQRARDLAAPTRTPRVLWIVSGYDEVWQAWLKTLEIADTVRASVIISSSTTAWILSSVRACRNFLLGNIGHFERSSIQGLTSTP